MQIIGVVRCTTTHYLRKAEERMIVYNMSICYNPVTRPRAVKTEIIKIIMVPPTDSHYTFYTKIAKSSKDAALSENVTGTVAWFENGNLYKGHSVGSFECHPVIQEPTILSGIHWSTAYFLSKESAEKWSAACGCRHDGVEYSKENDVYSVHFHHIDNPSCLKVGFSTSSEKSKSLSRMSLDG